MTHASASPDIRLTAIDLARGLTSHGAELLVVQDAVEAAIRLVETRGFADRAAF